MINRILIRIKIVQLVFAYYKSGEKDYKSAEKELFHSIEKTYELYFYLLLLAVEITRYARLRMDNALHKFRPSDRDLAPNRRFVDNLFIAQLEQNEHFNSFIGTQKLAWTDHAEVVKSLHESMINSSLYEEYMEGSGNNYEEDKDLWRRFFRHEVLNSELLESTLEEQNIYWCTELDFVISFILKTIKRFDQSKGSSQPLLAMYNHEDDRDFAKQLFYDTITKGDENRKLIDEFTKNWELDRIAYMDVIIMMVALGELRGFPTIPVNVTLNEYIELAKQYSTDKSATFVNGVLDKIVEHLRQEGQLIKVN
ncbi:transcription antitermination factor NusB [Microbacter margulisiae]|uniref:N utilization substance protein B n=1 Tax=Microbacter margulisiae TaxID=1350067 RepID=A0A7W5DSI5_9PORP|nr:transcription antitermination factor NusB [Microbacter margulisiae]MBB3187779.1 N utilization substance protein B [Microbacter margulisiae]